MRALLPDLIRERCSYPARPPLPTKPPTTYEWKFVDQFGNRYGRFFFRPRGATDGVWTDIYGHDVHQSEFCTGVDFAVSVVADDEAFFIHVISPPAAPREIYRQSERLEVHGLSSDGRFLLVQSAIDGDWRLPGLCVLDLQGRVLAQLDCVAGVRGCWAGAWSPAAGDARIIFRHEAAGCFQPALWWPFEDRVQDLSTDLEGEVFPIWHQSGQALILKRCLDGRSDLWRLRLPDRRLENLQPLDGSIFSLAVDAEDRAVGHWTSNERYVVSFCEKERTALAGFEPKAPLHASRFRRVAGVPCFLIGATDPSRSQWTIFDGYGMAGYHHTDAYNSTSQAFADHGFQIVMVNTRGSAGFGRAWREAKRGNLGFTELEDMARVRSALVAEGLVDGQRTIISGASWGGLMTLLAIGTQPDLWRMAVAYAPVGDYEMCHWEASPLIRATNRAEFGGSQRTHPAAYRKVSPLTYVDRIRAPVFILSGTHDLLCPPKQNISFVEALRAQGGECEFELFEGGHGAPDRDARIRHISLMLEFMLKRCGAIDAQTDVIPSCPE